jgi:hypothetical protein
VRSLSVLSEVYHDQGPLRQPLATIEARSLEPPVTEGIVQAVKILAALLLLRITLAAAPSVNAPADRYFGRLRMSALRIRYEIAQLKSRYDNHKLLPENTSHLAGLTAEAYYDWAGRYPKDGWLASTGLNLAHLYEDLPGAPARSAATKALTFVSAHFPNTRYSKHAAAELSHGVVLKPDPLWAIKMRATPTPSPTPLRGITPSPSPNASGSPRDSPSPGRTPLPAPTNS